MQGPQRAQYAMYRINHRVGLIYVSDVIICINLKRMIWFSEYKVPSIIKALSHIPVNALYPAIIDISLYGNVTMYNGKGNFNGTKSRCKVVKVIKHSPVSYDVEILNA